MSDDRGDSWRQVTDFQPILNRPFYYMNLDAHPTNPDRLWGQAEGFWQSDDAGETWVRRSTPHGDNHDLWINPDHPEIWIQSNDWGANVTLDAGETCSQPPSSTRWMSATSFRIGCMRASRTTRRSRCRRFPRGACRGGRPRSGSRMGAARPGRWCPNRVTRRLSTPTARAGSGCSTAGPGRRPSSTSGSGTSTGTIRATWRFGSSERHRSMSRHTTRIGCTMGRSSSTSPRTAGRPGRRSHPT